MKVTINNQEYYISFPETTNYVEGPITTSRSIGCNIKKSNQKDKVEAATVSYTYHKDRFVRTTGEKLALAKAMTIMNWSKSERTEVWNAYLNSSRRRRKLVTKPSITNHLEQVH